MEHGGAKICSGYASSHRLIANAAIHAAGRRMDWVNIPTLDVIEDRFFAPLADLNFSETRVFLGAIHNNTTLKARLKVAQKYLPKFGLSAYCGFGRLEPMPWREL